MNEKRIVATARLLVVTNMAKMYDNSINILYITLEDTVKNIKMGRSKNSRKGIYWCKCYF